MARYSEVTVSLVGTDGNSFALIGRVQRALQDAGIESSEVVEFTEKCFKASSYDELLQFLMETVNVE